MNASIPKTTVRVQQEARGEWSVYFGGGYLSGPFARREDAQKWADDYDTMNDIAADNEAARDDEWNTPSEGDDA